MGSHSYPLMLWTHLVLGKIPNLVISDVKQHDISDSKPSTITMTLFGTASSVAALQLQGPGTDPEPGLLYV